MLLFSRMGCCHALAATCLGATSWPPAVQRLEQRLVDEEVVAVAAVAEHQDGGAQVAERPRVAAAGEVGGAPQELLRMGGGVVQHRRPDDGEGEEHHQPSEQEVTVALDRADLRWLVDMDDMSPMTAQVQDGKTLLRLTVPARWARAVAGYRMRPAGVQLSMPGGRVQRDGTLSYSVTVAGEGQEPVMGGVLMEAEVTGPDGKPVSRFGGSFAPLSGTQTVRVPVPVNAAQGNYGLTIRFPQWGATSSTRFQVE
jgi:hypothetical protein